jgi:GT2 family glycosyltransferase
LLSALQIATWLVALAWLFKLIEAARGLPTLPDLSRAEYDRTPAGEPTITVIVPARDEAGAIAACLESLVAQDCRGLRIVAVNDRSTDGTGAIMDALAAASVHRLEVVHIQELPAGWLGKTHAIALAARRAIADHAPDYLLFTDADVFFAPQAIRRSLVEAAASDADHFITMPTTLARTAGEAGLLSFMHVMGLWAARPWRVADPRSRDAIGVGAFNLMRTRVYLQLGGFDAMPMEILEDLTLGRRVKRAGLRQRVAVAPGMVTVHWAAGVAGIINGMTKNLFAVFRFRPLLLLGAALWLSLFCIAPVAMLALHATRVPATLCIACVAGVYALSGRYSRMPAWAAVFFPIAAPLFVYSMLRSMFITLRDGGVTWRGTFYPLVSLREESAKLERKR